MLQMLAALLLVVELIKPTEIITSNNLEDKLKKRGNLVKKL